MKLGVLTVALGDMSLDAACKFLSEQGVQMVEIGCGGFPGTAPVSYTHLDVYKRQLFYHLQRQTDVSTSN